MQCYFDPPEGFVKGNYVIFHDSSNPYAQGVRAESLSSSAYQTQLAELISLMKALAANERAKETNYILAKINQLESDKLKSQITTLLNSNDPYRLSAIINLIIKTKEELDRILQQYDEGADRGALKSSGVYDRKFKQYMYSRINEYIEGRGKNSSLSVDLNLSLAEIIEDYLKNIVFNGIDVEKDIPDLYKETSSNLLEELRKKGIFPESWFDKGGTQKKITKRSLTTLINKVETKGGKGGSIRQKLNKLIPSVISGIGLEWQSTGEGIKMIGRAEHTGATEVKEDVVIIDALKAELEIDDNFFKDNLQGLDIIARVRKMSELMNEIAGHKGAYLLAISNKDYGSSSNLHVGSGSIANLVPRLNRIAQAVGEPNDTFYKILFNLNNAAEDGDPQNALDTLALLCAAWMFDDIEQMFKQGGNDNILHIYNINGYYMLLSDLLNQAADEVKGINPRALVDVSLSSWGGAHAMWEEQRVNYLTKHGSQGSKQPTAPIWKEVRKNMMKQSTVSIKLKYNTIEAFSSSLRALLRNFPKS